MMLQFQFLTMNSISAREIAADEQKPSSSGSAHSSPERLTPRNKIGCSLAATTIRLPEVAKQGSPFDSAAFIAIRQHMAQYPWVYSQKGTAPVVSCFRVGEERKEIHDLTGRQPRSSLSGRTFQRTP